MEILKGIGEWILIIGLFVLLWKPFWRFMGHVLDNAYGRLVAIGGSIVLLIVAGVVFSLFGPK
jgi:hypothetical protein